MVAKKERENSERKGRKRRLSVPERTKISRLKKTQLGRGKKYQGEETTCPRECRGGKQKGNKEFRETESTLSKWEGRYLSHGWGFKEE